VIPVEKNNNKKKDEVKNNEITGDNKEKIIRTVKISLISIFLLVILLYATPFGLKTYSFLGDSLLIKAAPGHQSLQLYSNESREINFEFEISNSMFCRALCEYHITDSRSGTILNGSIILWPGKNTQLSSPFTAPEKGRGQIFYEAVYKCTNIGNFLCQDIGKIAHQNSLVTINYIPTEEMMKSSQNAREIISRNSEIVIGQDLLNQKNSIIIGELSSRVLMDDIIRLQDESISRFWQAEGLYQEMRTSWDEENYQDISTGEEDLILHLGHLSELQERIYVMITERLQAHSILSLRLIILRDDVKDFLNGIADEEISKGIVHSYDSFLALYGKFLNLDFSSYDEIMSEYEVLRQENELTRAMILSKYYSAIKLGGYLYGVEQDKMCAIKGICMEKETFYYDDDLRADIQTMEGICENLEDMNKSFSRSMKEYAYKYFILHYPSNTTFHNRAITYDNAYDFLYEVKGLAALENDSSFKRRSGNIVDNIFIDTANSIIMAINSRGESYNAIIPDLNMASISRYLMSNETSSFCSQLIEYHNNMNVSYIDSFLSKEALFLRIKESCFGETNLSINGFGVLPLIVSTIQETVTSDDEPFDNSLMYLAYRPGYYKETIDFMQKNCMPRQDGMENMRMYLDSIAITVPSVDYSRMISIDQRINTTINEHEPLCCVFQECRPCCHDKECRRYIKNPIIFVHGHSFSKSQSPLYSINILDDIQSSMEIEGYINAGTVLPNSVYAEIPGNDWGISGHPVTVKYSYYFGAHDSNGTIINVVNNSESISEYASRLGKGIELILFRTGAEKVDIIAHSMGGLVARKYIQSYGGEHVGKLIMIGTPNNGIYGNVRKACDFFGAEKECMEMYGNSDFLNDLNRFNFSSTQVKYHNIIGKGCDTDGEDGDGVVRSGSAFLPYAHNEYINGTCNDIFNPLHNLMLDTVIHSNTLENIKKILKE
jgi:hypothetical protein